MDEIDLANQHAEMHLNHALARRRPTIAPTGRCLNCDNTLEVPRLFFCDTDCQRDHERRDRA